MSPETAEIAIKELTRAGQACAEAGSPEKGIEVVLEMGSPYEARKLLKGTLGVSRCWKT